MKVLKKGRPQKGWSIEMTCTGAGNGNGGCGALLLVSEDDIYETQSHCRDETDYYRTFNCPECGVRTDIPYEKMGAVWSRTCRKRPIPEMTPQIA